MPNTQLLGSQPISHNNTSILNNLITGLKTWFHGMAIGKKIGIGYTLSVGIAVLGPITGQFFTHNFIEVPALKRNDAAAEKSRSLVILKDAVFHAKSDIIPYLENPNLLKNYSYHLIEQADRAEILFLQLQVIANKLENENSNIADLKIVLETHHSMILMYDRELQRVLEEVSLKRNSSEIVFLQETREILFEFIGSQAVLNLQDLKSDLDQLLKDARLEEREADAIALQAKILQTRVMYGSLILSVALAIAFGYYTSLTIARPLQKLTQVSQDATQTSNFDVQIPVSRHDEVGILTTALNNLIGRVKQLLEEQQTAKEQLEIRVEERTAQFQQKSSELKAILDAFPDLFFRHAADGTILSCQIGHQERNSDFTPEKVLGKRLVECFPPELGEKFQAAIAQTLRTQSLASLEYSQPVPTGEEYYEARFVPAGDQEAIGVIRNISDRKIAEQALRASEQKTKEKALELEAMLQELRRTQAQMIHSEKMSSLGQMVAGVAHEINNPVSFVHGNLVHTQEYAQDLLRLVKLYQQHFPNPPEEIQDEIEAIDLEFLGEDLEKILKSMRVGTERIRDIVLSLRNFSRLDEAEFKDANLHEGIENTLMILQNRLKANPKRPKIEVIREYGELSAIECCPGQLNQVFMNIFSNAIDALEESGVRSQASEKQATIAIRTQKTKDNWIAIQIADNGMGIPENVRAKLFDPFFTTKPIGKGTGLGLSISYQIIVERHSGRLSCHSEPGKGTEFTIEIPIRQYVT